MHFIHIHIQKNKCLEIVFAPGFHNNTIFKYHFMDIPSATPASSHLPLYTNDLFISKITAEFFEKLAGRCLSKGHVGFRPDRLFVRRYEGNLCVYNCKKMLVLNKPTSQWHIVQSQLACIPRNIFRWWWFLSCLSSFKNHLCTRCNFRCLLGVSLSVITCLFNDMHND